jgi:hypothetical protein
MVRVRCRQCNIELSSSSKSQCCGCGNQMILHDDVVTAVDLNNVVLIKSEDSIKNQGILTVDDLKYQEERRKRKIRKLTFEER